MIADAIIRKPQRIATRLGVISEIMHLVMPKMSEVVMNSAYRMFPDSAAALGKRSKSKPTYLHQQQAVEHLAQDAQRLSDGVLCRLG